MRIVELTVSQAQSEKRLDQYLAHALADQVSRTQVQKIIRTKGILLNGQYVKKSSVVLKCGDTLQVQMDDDSSSQILTGQKIPLDVIFEDTDILIVNKKAGQVVHPGPGHREGTLVHALLGAQRSLSDVGGSERPGIVHRLDKDTSGLLVIAKNNRIHCQLTRLFQSRSIRKTYYALVEGRVDYEEGCIDDPIGRHPSQRTKMAVRSVPQGKTATTEYRVLERFKYTTFLRLNLRTGRTHQIRVHLSHRGHPVLGDALYGKVMKESRIALHSGELEFKHPLTKKKVQYKARLPEDFMKMLEFERKR